MELKAFAITHVKALDFISYCHPLSFFVAQADLNLSFYVILDASSYPFKKLKPYGNMRCDLLLKFYNFWDIGGLFENL